MINMRRYFKRYIKRKPGRHGSVGDLAWVAGMIDGDGSIVAYARRGNQVEVAGMYIRVEVTQVAREALVWIWKALGGLGTIRRARPKPGHWDRERTQYAWRVWSLEGEIVLRLILPYLKLKKRQAELCLQARQLVKGPGNCLGGGIPIHDWRRIKGELTRLNKRYGKQGNHKSTPLLLMKKSTYS